MKKISFLVLTLLLVMTSMITVAEESISQEYDFKKFRWGVSPSEVKSIEGEPLFDGDVSGQNAEYIAYKTSAVGLDMFLAYYFCDSGLYQVRYILTEEHTNEDLYIEDYEKFRSAMTKKYGTPLFDYVKWNDDSMKEYYQKNGKSMGDALCYGYCSYITWYATDRTDIWMTMDADNYEISMIIDYKSNSIGPGEADYSDEI